MPRRDRKWVDPIVTKRCLVCREDFQSKQYNGAARCKSCSAKIRMRCEISPPAAEVEAYLDAAMANELAPPWERRKLRPIAVRTCTTKGIAP